MVYYQSLARILGTVQEESDSELPEIIALVLECDSGDRKIRVNLSLIALQFLALTYKKRPSQAPEGLSRDSGTHFMHSTSYFNLSRSLLQCLYSK